MEMETGTCYEPYHMSLEVSGVREESQSQGFKVRSNEMEIYASVWRESAWWSTFHNISSSGGYCVINILSVSFHDTQAIANNDDGIVERVQVNHICSGMKNETFLLDLLPVDDAFLSGGCFVRVRMKNNETNL